MPGLADVAKAPRNSLLGLRRRGMSAVIVHHAGKGGLQRGTSRREDVLDTIIALRRPKDYDATEGARFEVHFEKNRGFTGEVAQALEAQLTVNTLGAASWTVTALGDRLVGDVADLVAQGKSERQISIDLGISRSKVTRLSQHCSNNRHENPGLFRCPLIGQSTLRFPRRPAHWQYGELCLATRVRPVGRRGISEARKRRVRRKARTPLLNSIHLHVRRSC